MPRQAGMIAGVAVHRALAVHRPGQDSAQVGLGPSERIGAWDSRPPATCCFKVSVIWLVHHIVKVRGLHLRYRA